MGGLMDSYADAVRQGTPEAYYPALREAGGIVYDEERNMYVVGDYAGARQALSIGIILMVISEMFAASNGVGFTIIQFQRSFAIPQMWTGIIVLGLIGILLSAIFRFVERRVLSWYLGVRESHRTEG